MAQSDVSLSAEMRSPRRPSTALRWMIRSMLVLCGLLMLTVVLSEPRVAEKVEASLGRFETLLAGKRTAAVPDGDLIVAAPNRASAPSLPVVSETSTTERPAVRVLPQNRTPVRRAGISSGN